MPGPVRSERASEAPGMDIAPGAHIRSSEVIRLSQTPRFSRFALLVRSQGGRGAAWSGPVRTGRVLRQTQIARAFEPVGLSQISSSHRFALVRGSGSGCARFIGLWLPHCSAVPESQNPTVPPFAMVSAAWHLLQECRYCGVYTAFLCDWYGIPGVCVGLSPQFPHICGWSFECGGFAE